jgi:Rho guanine nucleotide exchange factor 17
MKEIETLSVDCNKLQQMLDIAASLRCPHQMLEETIRDLQSAVQRQLSDRQTNDSQLNVLELNVIEHEP